MRAALRMEEEAQNWEEAAVYASNLSETELLVGDVAAAVVRAESSVAAPRRNLFWRLKP
jgi:hypothetical protein